jgi:hypothetical protein
VSARDFLERLRPSAAPGAPTMAGVPADRVADRSAELEGLFAQVADAQVEAGRIRAAAAQEAGRRRETARAQALAIVAEARRRADAERSAAAAAAHAAGQALTDRILLRAHADAEAIRQRARDNEPALVAEILRQARAEVAAQIGPGT